MKDLLEYLVKAIVKKPEDVKIKEKEDNTDVIILDLSVAEEDMGKVIGKEGKIIKAIRTLVRIIAIKQGKKVLINLEDKNPPIKVLRTDPLVQSE